MANPLIPFLLAHAAAGVAAGWITLAATALPASVKWPSRGKYTTESAAARRSAGVRSMYGTWYFARRRVMNRLPSGSGWSRPKNRTQNGRFLKTP